MKSSITSILLICLIATCVYTDGCSQFCQKCITPTSGPNQCAVCYRSLLTNGTCQVGGPANCDVAVSDTYCFRCSQRYFLDYSTGQCVLNTSISKCITGTIDSGTVLCSICT